MNILIAPLSRAVAQFDDPVFLGVLGRGILWSIACFAALHVGAIWIVHRTLELHGILAWVVDILGSVAASVLAMWLFVPVAAAIGTLYFDRIANAVERRWYPWMPPPEGAPLTAQIWDGLAVGVRILLLNAVGLILTVTLPGIGLFLAWGIAAYAIGRGLFVAVAMRRMDRETAKSLYRRTRGPVLLVGGAIALIAWLPLVNLLIPVLAVAAMVHLLDIVMNPAL
jgi:CysZ protein